MQQSHTTQGGHRYMNLFLSVVASAFQDQAGICYYKGQAKPEGTIPREKGEQGEGLEVIVILSNIV